MMTNQLAISNVQCAIHLQIAMSLEELNRQSPIANVSLLANGKWLIAPERSV